MSKAQSRQRRAPHLVGGGIAAVTRRLGNRSSEYAFRVAMNSAAKSRYLRYASNVAGPGDPVNSVNGTLRRTAE